MLQLVHLLCFTAPRTPKTFNTRRPLHEKPFTPLLGKNTTAVFPTEATGNSSSLWLYGAAMNLLMLRQVIVSAMCPKFFERSGAFPLGCLKECWFFNCLQMLVLLFVLFLAFHALNTACSPVIDSFSSWFGNDVVSVCLEQVGCWVGLCCQCSLHELAEGIVSFFLLVREGVRKNRMKALEPWDFLWLTVTWMKLNKVIQDWMYTFSLRQAAFQP